MKIIGLTGGIGSGKTTVAEMFRQLGVPVYIADLEARNLTNNSSEIREEIMGLLGSEAYVDGSLDRTFVAGKVFGNKSLLKQLNRIIHPRVADHFKSWLKMQIAPYVIKEAAILFESGGYKDCDHIILVTAPKKERIRRVVIRDKTTPEAVKARMANQWNEKKKRDMADFIIENLDIKSTRTQVKHIHEALL